MRHLKRFLLLITSLIIIFTVTACSSSSSNGKSTDDSIVTLKVWFPGSDEIIKSATNKMVSDFEKANPNIKVELTLIPYKDYFQKLSVAYSGGIAPDVHGLGFGQLISTVDQDKYMDLNKFIKKENWDGESDIFPSILKAGQYNGGQYGLLMPEVRPYVWRKDFFKEAGLDPNKGPQTMDEVFQIAEKLSVAKNGKTVRSGIDIATQNNDQSYLSLALPLGLNIYDEKGNPTFDSAQSIDLVEKMVKLHKKGVIMDYDQMNINGSEFQNSLAATGFSPSQSLKILEKSVGQDQIGWSLPPKGPDGKQTSLMMGTFMAMSKNTKHSDEAWKFLKYWFDKENIYKFSVATGFVPSRQSLKDQYVGENAQNKFLFEALNDAQGYYPSKYWATDVKYLRLALEEAFQGTKSPAQALKDNAQKAREENKQSK